MLSDSIKILAPFCLSLNGVMKSGAIRYLWGVKETLSK